MKVYKIRNKETGMFKCKGSWGWSEKGKTWSSIGHLKNHLRLHYWDKRQVSGGKIIEQYLKDFPKVEILEITIEETNTKVIT